MENHQICFNNKLSSTPPPPVLLFPVHKANGQLACVVALKIAPIVNIEICWKCFFFIYCIYFSQLSFLLFSAGCISFCCPCITFGQNVEIIDRGTTCKLQKKKKTKHEQFIQYFINWYSFLPSSCTSWFIIWLCAACAHAGFIYYCLAHVGFASCYSCTYRTKLRASFNLPEDPCADCLVHCCCLPCAVCQEYRELKNRGVDPSIGNWPGFF